MTTPPPLTLVKVGGAVVEQADSLSQLLQAFRRIPSPKVLVHGGGRSATDLAARLGIQSHFALGRRITDAPTLQVVTMVYGGLVNKRIVAQMQALGINALGLTGADMDILRAHRRPPVPATDGGEPLDFGYVGDVDSCNALRLAQLLHSGITPVIAPLTHDGKGNLLNTNADTVAAEVAKALAPLFSVSLVYCFEKPGVLSDPNDPSSLIPFINEADFRRLVAQGTISGGMIPKVENALAACRAGVREVLITRADQLTPPSGTRIQLR